MKIDEQIKELIAQAENDYGAAEALYKAGYYAHALFWAHLVLENYARHFGLRVKEMFIIHIFIIY